MADALSCKEVEVYVAALTTVTIDFLNRLRQQANEDPSYCQLREKIKQGLIRRYWVEDDLIYARGGRTYVPSRGDLQRILLQETHDP